MRSLLFKVLKGSPSSICDFRLCASSKQIKNYSSQLKNPDKGLNKNTIKPLIPSIMPVFEGRIDRFDGVTVYSDKEPCDLLEFTKKFEESMKVWKETNRRAVWFRVDLKQADWVPVLAKNGFTYHHAKDGFVMMYKWLSDETCNIPPYAHTSIGVGALVINDKSQILVVKERHFLTPNWKMPGGYVEPNEEFIDAAIREVQEETNIKTQFVSLMALRHAHGGQFGCSDLYIVIHLKALTTEITKDERELSECMWMDLQEFLNHPHVHELNRLFVKKYLDLEKDKIKIDKTTGIHQLLKKPYTVYHISKM